MSSETHYAPAEKGDDKQLATQIDSVTNNPLLDGLLHTVSGLIAVLNEDRQIISLNETFMEAIGVDKPEEAFGLRHGAALECIHGEEVPAGCGTTEYCSTYGARCGDCYIAQYGKAGGENLVQRREAQTLFYGVEISGNSVGGDEKNIQQNFQY